MMPKPTIIKDLRKRFNISQIELERKLKIPQSTISRIENGVMNPPYSIIKKIFNFFLEYDSTLFPLYNKIFKIQEICKKIETETNQFILELEAINRLGK